MFVGSLDATMRTFLGNVAGCFNGRRVAIGCSGNFTMECLFTEHAPEATLHANDVSLYSSLLGHWLAGTSLEWEPVDPDYLWLAGYRDDPARSAAAIAVLLDALPFACQKTPHHRRMWNAYRSQFDTLVDKTIERYSRVTCRISSYFAGDVWEHFQRHDQPGTIFACYSPTYRGGYERQYKKLDAIIAWQRPSYPLLDNARRDALLRWCSERLYCWIDDRVIEGLTPICQRQASGSHTVYVYSNCIDRTGYFAEFHREPMPNYPLADGDFTIRPDSHVAFSRIKTSDLSRFKDAYLGKNIDHSSGTWAWAICIDARVIGFCEFARTKYGAEDGTVYLFSDFAVSGTRYKKLSKLVVMLATCRDARRAIERVTERRVKRCITTAFTERAVSMKYRGCLELIKRGEKDGKKFLNYAGDFSSLSASETLAQWLTKHAT